MTADLYAFHRMQRAVDSDRQNKASQAVLILAEVPALQLSLVPERPYPGCSLEEAVAASPGTILICSKPQEDKYIIAPQDDFLLTVHVEKIEPQRGCLSVERVAVNEQFGVTTVTLSTGATYVFHAEAGNLGYVQQSLPPLSFDFQRYVGWRKAAGLKVRE